MTYDEGKHWRDRANCLGLEMQPEEATPKAVEKLKAECTGCPVFAQCDGVRRELPYPFGVFAGKWWGPPPSDKAVECSVCSTPIWAETTRREFCSSTCRKRAHRSRERELAAAQ